MLPKGYKGVSALPGCTNKTMMTKCRHTETIMAAVKAPDSSRDLLPAFGLASTVTEVTKEFLALVQGGNRAGCGRRVQLFNFDALAKTP
jgi:hypothetical protein